MALRNFAVCLFCVLTPAVATGQTLALTPVNVSSTAGARAIVTADFDGNGWADVAHANFGANNVTVLLNRGGTLTKRGDTAVGNGPFDMTSADFNMDGKADLAVANADANTISVLLGRGDGTFTRTDISAPGHPRGITAADMNNDGRPDLVYTGYAINRVQILTGSGGGGFTAEWSITGVANRPQGVEAADLNNDGRRDLAVAYADPTGGGVAILTRTASGPFSAQRLGGPRNLNVVAVADFDKNGWMDVAAASTANNHAAVFLGSDEGLTWAANYPVGASPRGIEVADLNHDGALDIVTANRDGDSVSVIAARGDAPGSFTPTMHFTAGAGSRAVAVGDFNHDGRRDLATANQDVAAATLLENDTRLERAAFGFRLGTLPTDEWNSGEQVVADLNHNGVPDLVMRDVNGTVAVIDGSTSVPIQSNYEVRAVADVNLDGHQDTIGRAWNGAYTVMRILYGDGTGRFTPGVDLSIGASGWDDVADMNRDGRPDLVVTHWEETTQSSYVDVYLNNSNGSWGGGLRFQLSSRWAISIELADLNRDGVTDVITSQFQPNQINVMLGTGGGHLAPATTYGTEDYGYVFVEDMNHDGAPDVILGGWETTMLWMGSRTGDLTIGARYPYGAIWLDIADMNQDGHPDLVTTYAGLIAHGRGDGTFAEPEFFRFDTAHIAIADLNVDGLPDVIGGHTVGFNRRGTGNAPPVLQPMRDWELDYIWQFGEEDFELWADARDPDMHALTYEWRDGSGRVLQSGPRDSYTLRLNPGTYAITVTVRDGRGGSASETLRILVRPNPELAISRAWWDGWIWTNGTWTDVPDDSAAGGMRFEDPNQGAPKAPAPLAHPQNYLAVEFAADPTQTYKLWVRMKAADNYWGNDSIFVQFSGATDVNGSPIYRDGTTSGLAINLEQCSNCGISGWGWRDERWGTTLNSEPVLLRFPQGGWQRIVIQTREDGVSVDQIVLSAERFRTAAPGPAKNDNTIVTR